MALSTLLNLDYEFKAFLAYVCFYIGDFFHVFPKLPVDSTVVKIVFSLLIALLIPGRDKEDPIVEPREILIPLVHVDEFTASEASEILITSTGIYTVTDEEEIL